MAGQGLQQGGAAIQQPKNASDTRCGTRAGLHTGAFLSWRAETAGLPLVSALQAAGPGAAGSGFIPAPGSALPVLLSAVDVVQLGPQPSPGSRVLPETRLCAHSFAVFLFSAQKYTSEEHYSAPVCTPRAQTDFLRAHQCLETQTDTQEAPSSSPGTTPLSQAHKHLFLSLKIQPQPLGSAGTGACSSALSARHGDRPQTSQQHQCLPRQSGTGIGRGYCLEWGDHVSVSPSPPWPGRAVECHRKSAYKGRGKIKIDPVAAWCARSRARLAKGQCLSPALSCSLVDGITGVF